MSETRDAKSYLDYLRIRADEMTEAEIKGDYEEMIDVIRRELSTNWNSMDVNPSEPGDYIVVYSDKTKPEEQPAYGIFSWMTPVNEELPFFGMATGNLEWNMDLKAMINKDNIKMLAWRKIPFYCE